MSVSPAAPAPSRRAQQIKLLLLAFLFFGPLALAFLMYYGGIGYRAGGNTAHGRLFDPVRPLPAATLTALDGADLGSDVLRGKWLYVVLGSGSCNESCLTRLHDTRQARLLLGKDATRVRRVYLTAGGEPDPALCGSDTDLVCARPGGDSGRALLSTFDAAEGREALNAGAVYLVDPHGNLVLGYGPTDLTRSLLEDTKRLLKYSHIG